MKFTVTILTLESKKSWKLNKYISNLRRNNTTK